MKKKYRVFWAPIIGIQNLTASLDFAFQISNRCQHNPSSLKVGSWSMPFSNSALSFCGSPMWACSFPCLFITQNGTTNLSSTPAAPVLKLPAGTVDVPPRSFLQTKVFTSPSCSQCWLLTALSCYHHRKSTLTWHDLLHQEIEVSTHMCVCKHMYMQDSPCSDWQTQGSKA